MAGVTANYADVLFELANDHDALDQWLAQAVAIRDVLQTKKGRSTIEHPRMSGAEKRGFLREVLPADTPEDMIGFLHMLVSERQEKQIVPALAEFVTRGRREDEKIVAHVVSAVALKEEQTAALEEMLYQKLGRQVELSAEVDPSLIGGFCIYVAGLVIDRTVKKQLNDLRDTIKRGGAV
ncbi:MAG: ATP synthase F1 subunit delta [Clostridia bacterium]|nr:ATP synthase F1 subunit delta [Clostridia bacterium]